MDGDFNTKGLRFTINFAYRQHKPHSSIVSSLLVRNLRLAMHG